MDFGDVIVHVFLAETRAYYDLDRLWADAPVERWELADSDDQLASAEGRLAARLTQVDARVGPQVGARTGTGASGRRARAGRP